MGSSRKWLPVAGGSSWQRPGLSVTTDCQERQCPSEGRSSSRPTPSSCSVSSKRTSHPVSSLDLQTPLTDWPADLRALTHTGRSQRTRARTGHGRQQRHASPLPSLRPLRLSRPSRRTRAVSSRCQLETRPHTRVPLTSVHERPPRNNGTSVRARAPTHAYVDADRRILGDELPPESSQVQSP